GRVGDGSICSEPRWSSTSVCFCSSMRPRLSPDCQVPPRSTASGWTSRLGLRRLRGHILGSGPRRRAPTKAKTSAGTGAARIGWPTATGRLRRLIETFWRHKPLVMPQERHHRSRRIDGHQARSAQGGELHPRSRGQIALSPAPKGFALNSFVTARRRRQSVWMNWRGRGTTRSALRARAMGRATPSSSGMGDVGWRPMRRAEPRQRAAILLARPLIP
ncbi:hypothetical protein LTR94_030446, partial [Friedmanniomyces endolithicus]